MLGRYRAVATLDLEVLDVWAVQVSGTICSIQYYLLNVQ